MSDTRAEQNVKQESARARAWRDVPAKQLNALTIRRAIHGATMTVARFELLRGAGVPLHSHLNEQISMVESGRVRFIVAGVETILSAGEFIHLPAHVPHSAEALEDSVAVDLFSPPREDWIRGDA